MVQLSCKNRVCVQDYCEFNSLIANGKKGPKNLVVLVWRLRNLFPEANNELNFSIFLWQITPQVKSLCVSVPRAGRADKEP